MLLALAAGSDAARVAAQPVPSASAIKLDGELSEEVWQSATVVSGFRQREPNEGAAPAIARNARRESDVFFMPGTVAQKGMTRPALTP